MYGRVYIKIVNRLLKFKSFRGEYFEWDFNRVEQKFDFSMNMLLSEEKYVLIFVEIIFLPNTQAKYKKKNFGKWK